MSGAYAKGKNAIGLCQRCGFKFKLSALREDGDTHLLVCSECFDIPHPAERPINAADAMALRRPSPDVDAALADVLDDDRPLGEILFGAGAYFGEQP